MTNSEPLIWVALNNYSTPRGALEEDRELNDELPSLENYEDPKGPLELATYLNESVDGNYGWKLNGDLLLEGDLGMIIEKFRNLGRPIFADLKLLKGGGTMSRIVDSVSDKDVEYTNIYAFADDLIKRSTGKKTKLLGLTVLTHHPDEYYQEMFNKNKVPVIKSLSRRAYENGCDGLILPPTSLEALKTGGKYLEKIFDEMYKVTPGIRPSWDERSEKMDKDSKKKDKQSQKATPTEAFERGSNALVVGSPIYRSREHSIDSRSPSKALESILEEIESFV